MLEADVLQDYTTESQNVAEVYKGKDDNVFRIGEMQLATLLNSSQIFLSCFTV